MIRKLADNSSTGEVIALRMLAFLASDETRLETFMTTTGIEPGQLRVAAADPEFLSGVMDHVLNDQSLLLAFCAESDLAPEAAVAARRALPGASYDF